MTLTRLPEMAQWVWNHICLSRVEKKSQRARNKSIICWAQQHLKHQIVIQSAHVMLFFPFMQKEYFRDWLYITISINGLSMHKRASPFPRKFNPILARMLKHRWCEDRTSWTIDHRTAVSLKVEETKKWEVKNTRGTRHDWGRQKAFWTSPGTVGEKVFAIEKNPTTKINTFKQGCNNDSLYVSIVHVLAHRNIRKIANSQPTILLLQFTCRKMSENANSQSTILLMQCTGAFC